MISYKSGYFTIGLLEKYHSTACIFFAFTYEAVMWPALSPRRFATSTVSLLYHSL